MIGLPRTAVHARVLVLGYGNELRRDDGVGPWVARAIADRGLPYVSVRALHQLTPELAADLAQYEQAIFVDACIGGAEDDPVELRPVQPEPAAILSAHAGTPGSLVALAEALFERAARCWVLAIPVADVGLGVGLSERARGNGERAIELLLETIDDRRRESAAPQAGARG